MACGHHHQNLRTNKKIEVKENAFNVQELLKFHSFEKQEFYMAISILHTNNFIDKNAGKASTQTMKLMYMQQGDLLFGLVSISKY